MSIHKNLTARDVVRLLKEDGWYEVAQKGAHMHFEHPVKPGKATVPIHGGTLPRGTLNSILRQTGLKGGRKA